MGSYDSDDALHYVTLRIDPNNYTGVPTSNFIGLNVNGTDVNDWENPIRLYDWGVPGDPVSDLYGIAANQYQITVSLTGLEALGDKKISILNVNLEGCFDTATPVPEPSAMVIFSAGLLGLAVVRRSQMT